MHALHGNRTAASPALRIFSIVLACAVAVAVAVDRKRKRAFSAFDNVMSNFWAADDDIGNGASDRHTHTHAHPRRTSKVSTARRSRRIEHGGVCSKCGAWQKIMHAFRRVCMRVSLAPRFPGKMRASGLGDYRYYRIHIFHAVHEMNYDSAGCGLARVHKS